MSTKVKLIPAYNEVSSLTHRISPTEMAKVIALSDRRYLESMMGALSTELMSFGKDRIAEVQLCLGTKL